LSRAAGRSLPGGVFAFLSLGISHTAGFGAPTSRAALEYVAVMQQAIEHGGDSGAVTQ
jgi:hypothetical protein